MLWLIGSGSMALEYSKVLNALKIKYSVIGRGKKSAQKFISVSKIKVISGGLSNFLDTNPACVNNAIVSVNTEELKTVTKDLINYGVRNILLEKPGGVNFDEIKDLYALVKKKK